MVTVGMLSLVFPLGLVLNLNKCYFVLVLSGYLVKSKNSGCSIFMDNTFHGHALVVNGLFLLNLDCNDTHIHSIEAKRCKVN
jgi:hypothetical protein